MSTNRRKVIKSINKDNLLCKKVATGDTRQDIGISKTQISITNAKPKKLKISINNNSKLEGQNQGLEELKEETTKMTIKLYNLKSQYDSENLRGIEKVNQLNEQLKEKNEKYYEISKENTKLFNTLKNIDKDCSEKYAKLLKKKMFKLKKNDIRTEEIVKKDIEINDKQIKNIQKINEASKKEQLKLEDFLKDVNNGLETSLRDETKDLNGQVNELKKEIKELSSIKKLHKTCNRQIQNLNGTLNILKNEIEFETKKTNMINSTINNNNKDNIEEKEHINNINNNFRKTNNLFQSRNEFSSKLRISILGKSPQPKQNLLNRNSYNYIQTELNTIKRKKRNKSLLGIGGKPMSVVDDIYIPEDNLFTDVEIEVLSKIIPEDYLQKFNERYETKMNEKEEKIAQIFEENDEMKNENLQTNYELDSLRMKIKEQERNQLELKIKYKKNNYQISQLKSEILKFQKKLNTQMKKLKSLNNIQKSYSLQEKKKHKIK